MLLISMKKKKYIIDKETSDIDIRRGQKECLLGSFLARRFMSVRKLLIK